MRVAVTLWVAIAAVASGCASRQAPITAEVSRAAPPTRYETTVTTYFDLTTRTPAAQRKLQFGEPEASNCRVLGSGNGHLGWVVPVTFEAMGPPPASPAPPVPAAVAPKVEPVVQVARAAPPLKGKAAKGKRTGEKPGKPQPVARVAGEPAPTAVAAAVAVAVPAPPDPGVVALDNVAVIGKTRYFFWFDREMINAVSKRLDVCP